VKMHGGVIGALRRDGGRIVVLIGFTGVKTCRPLKAMPSVKPIWRSFKMMLMNWCKSLRSTALISLFRPYYGAHRTELIKRRLVITQA